MVVPGSYEVPWAAQQLIQTAQNSLDAVLCFGVLIKGETMHFEYISSSVSSAIMNLQMSTGVPILYGILNCLTLEQAAARCGPER
jgi:6,7-dimethyl-8-ribityllumazine synthase